MSLTFTLLSLLAILLLTAGTAVFVAAEFSLTALERSTVDANAEVRRLARPLVQQAHRSLSFQLSGAQLGISITTLATGYLAEPVVARLLRPAARRHRSARAHARRRGPGAGAADRDVDLDGVRRAGAQEPGRRQADGRPRAGPRRRSGGSRGCSRRRSTSPTAPRTGSCAGWASSPPRNCGPPAHRRNWCRWCATPSAADPWTPPPPTWWTGRCSSVSARPRS